MKIKARCTLQSDEPKEYLIKNGRPDLPRGSDSYRPRRRPRPIFDHTRRAEAVSLFSTTDLAFELLLACLGAREANSAPLA